MTVNEGATLVMNGVLLVQNALELMGTITHNATGFVVSRNGGDNSNSK